MERVWLSSTYYMDPKLAGCSPAVEAMFTRLIAYAGNAETRGFLPENCHVLVAFPRKRCAVLELVSRKILSVEDGGGYQIVGWSNWQENGDKLLERRDKDRERKRRKRSESPDLSADMSAEFQPQRREEKRREEVVGTDTAPHLATVGASDDAHPGGPKVPVDGWSMVRDTAGMAAMPQATKTALAIAAAELLHAGTDPAHVAAALDLWLAKPSAGPGLLPHLVADVIKAETTTIASQPRSGPQDAKVTGYLHIGRKLTQQATQPQQSRRELA